MFETQENLGGGVASSERESLWKVGARKTGEIRCVTLPAVGGTGSTAIALHIEMQQFLPAVLPWLDEPVSTGAGNVLQWPLVIILP